MIIKLKIIFKIHTIIYLAIGIKSFIFCIGNGSLREIKSVDSMNSKSNTMNTATSENEQNVRMKNDTAAIR